MSPILLAELGLWVYHSVSEARALAALPPIEERALIPSQDSELRFEFNPGWSQGDFRVNSLGFADDETSADKPPGTFRIAVVGDSITANFKLEPRSVIFPTRLEALLESAPRAAGIERFEVLNLGVNGYSSPQIARMGRTRARQLGADAIIAQLCLNDPFTGLQRYADAPLDHPTRLLGLIARRIWPERAQARGYVDSRYTREGWQRVEDSFVDLADLNGEVPVLAVLIPYLAPAAYESWGFERYHQRIAALADAAGLPFVDLLEDFQRAGLVRAGPSQDPIHPDAAGHGLIAARLLEELERREMLDFPGGS